MTAYLLHNLTLCNVSYCLKLITSYFQISEDSDDIYTNNKSISFRGNECQSYTKTASSHLCC